MTPPPRRPSDSDSDSGASLLLAIAFVLMVGAISAGLLGLATSGLNNRSTLQTVRNREYAADGAVEQAIAQVRSLSCAAGNGFLVDASMNRVAIRVEWANACGTIRSGDRSSTAVASGGDGTVVAQRNVVFAACENTGTTCDATKVIIRATVDFQQAAGGAVTKAYVQSWSVNR